MARHSFRRHVIVVAIVRNGLFAAEGCLFFALRTNRIYACYNKGGNSSDTLDANLDEKLEKKKVSSVFMENCGSGTKK